MNQYGKELLIQARHDLAEGMDCMNSFDFSGARTWFQCTHRLLNLLQENVNMEDK